VSEAPTPRPGSSRAKRPGFTTRLLVSQTLVLVAMALTAWLVASVVGPGIFHDHLERAGVAHGSSETDHVKQAFASAMLLALLVALLTATLLALGVTWYFGRRVQRSISRVVDSAASVAAGDYSSRIPSPGLGGEFDELAGAFNSLAERLEAVESTRRRMLADLAHEMRTPLATLDAHLEALEDGVREPDANTFSVLRSSTERLGRLAQDMSAVSRAEEGSLDVHLEQSSPRPLVRAAVDAARERYVDKGVNLREEVTTDAPVLVDATRMGQVLGNLLDNALRHTPAGGAVTVSCHLRGAWVELEVADTGEGIEAEHLGHVFDRFYRADPSRNRSQGGSGIGLTITRALVEAQGGSISAHSDAPGRGATFTVRLPGPVTA